MTNLPQPPPNVAAAPQASNVVDALIPYKNWPALLSYYFGVFSFIPLLGALLGIPAVFLGMMGIYRASHRPQVKGKVHAWVGLILGLLVGVGQIVLFLFFLLSAT